MEKNLLIQNLKSKAGIDNLSDRTFEEVATAYLPMFAEDDKITDETWNLPVTILKTMSGQLRHEVAEGITKGKTQWETEQKTAQQKAIEDAVAAAKAEWEKNNPQNQQQQQQNQQQQQQQEPSLDEKIAAAVAKAMEGVTGEEGSIGKIAKQFSDYMAKTEQEKKDAIVNKLREDLKSSLLDVRLADREPVVNLAVKELEIKEDSDFDKLKIEVEKKYEKLYKDFYGDTAGGPYAGGAGGGSNSNKEFEDYIKAQKAAAEKAAEEAKALEAELM